MHGELLLTFFGAVLLISLVPGPDMLYVMANGMASGSRAGVVAALGMSTGLAVHTTAAALGLSALLQAAPLAMEAIRLFGIAFLCYLAIDAFRSSRAPQAELTIAPVRSMRRVYLMGALTNLANPKIILFYLAFFPQFVTPDSGWPIAVQMMVLGALFIVVGVMVDGSAGFACGRLSDFLTRRRGVRRWTDRVCAGIFGTLAARLIVDDPAR